MSETRNQKPETRNQKWLILAILVFAQNTHATDDIGFFISHAGGGYENTTYLNAVEAFEHNYQKGSRAFELDFRKTSDGVTVVFHSGFEELMGVPKGFTYADWTNYEKYPSPHNVTRMDLPIMMSLFKKYPDTYLITDHKNNPVILQEIIDCFLSNDISLNRLIPQLYSFEDINNIKNYPIENKILTIYIIIERKYRLWRIGVSRGEKKYKILDYIPFYRKIREMRFKRDLRIFLNSHPEIKILTMPISVYKEGYLNSLAEELGIKIYVHSAKDLKAAQQLKEIGVDGIYIDFI